MPSDTHNSDFTKIRLTHPDGCPVYIDPSWIRSVEPHSLAPHTRVVRDSALADYWVVRESPDAIDTRVKQCVRPSESCYRTAELLPEHRDRTWRDRDGDDWRFIDGTWQYRRPGVGSFSGLDEDEWDSTESDWEPEPRYGPFELVS